MDVFSDKGSLAEEGPHGTLRFEDTQVKLAYDNKCLTSGFKEESGVVGTYEIHYRMLGQDKPARLYFTPKGDKCDAYPTNWKKAIWHRIEP
jgi:hypothetical protein